MPRAGYWVQLEAGKPIVRPKLTDRSRYQELVEIKETVNEEPTTQIEKNINPKKTKNAQDNTSESAKIINVLSVANNLLEAHPLIRKTLKVLDQYKVRIEKSKKTKNSIGMLRRDEWPPHEDKGRYSFDPSDGALPIKVSLGMVNRILLFLDPILKGLEAKGFNVFIDTSDRNIYAHRLIVEQFGEQMTFWVSEGYSWHTPEENKKDTNPYHYISKIGVANGNLHIHIEGLMGGIKKTFSSGKRRTLEDQIDEIFNSFIEFPGDQKELRELRERERIEHDRRSEISRHNSAIATSQREQLDVALKEAATYRDYLALDEYLKQIEIASALLSERQLELSNYWQRIVRHYLAELDPVQKRIDHFKVIAGSTDHNHFYSEHWFKKSISDNKLNECDETDIEQAS